MRRYRISIKQEAILLSGPGMASYEAGQGVLVIVRIKCMSMRFLYIEKIMRGPKD